MRWYGLIEWFQDGWKYIVPLTMFLMCYLFIMAGNLFFALQNIPESVGWFNLIVFVFQSLCLLYGVVCFLIVTKNAKWG